MQDISTCLWFDDQAEAAANFYVSIFPGSRIDSITRAPADYPAGRQGDVLSLEFTLGGRSFIALNGGPEFHFSEAVSLSVGAEDQAEVDRLWAALTADGGEAGPCGWLKDRYGLSWQVVPETLPCLLADPDRAAAGRAMQAMMTMGKLDIAGLERAFQGEGQ